MENTGQIKLSQPFGEWISRIAADTRFQRYLEIGTWNGRGSTYCFHHGFIQRQDVPVLQSYEIHNERVKEAQSVWKNQPQIHIIHGRVLQDDQCPTYHEVTKTFPEVVESWHTEDVRNFWGCPYVVPNDPEVVLLDGAEYLTWFEFDRVFKTHPTIQIFMLDDTCAAKTFQINKYLLEHPEWKRIAYSDTERNGWAIFERITASSGQTLEILSDPEQQSACDTH